MQFTAYLTFNGNCEEAFHFYEHALGAKTESLFRHEGSPMEKEVPAEWRTKIMHASLKLDDGYLMGADVPPTNFKSASGFSVSIHSKDPADAEKKFAALANGGTVIMPIAQTFWARRFGMLIDRFGIPWMVNCE